MCNCYMTHDICYRVKTLTKKVGSSVGLQGKEPVYILTDRGWVGNFSGREYSETHIVSVLLGNPNLEVIEPEEEKKVINFEDVQVGDRVKLVNENGDTAEITVKAKYEKVVYANNHSFSSFAGWSVAEILEKPMPNKPGTILSFISTCGDVRGWYVKLKGSGWVSLDTGTKYSDKEVKACYNPKTVVTEYEPK